MRVFGIAGVAKAGKDTLALALIKEAEKEGLLATKVSLAEPLKDDINPFLIEKLGIDIWNCSPEEKEFVRPLLVAYGRAQREKTNGTYWTGLLSKRMKELKRDGYDLVIVPDIRYDEYPEDEVFWIKENGDALIHVSRLDEGGNKILPPNEDERLNDPKMIAAASNLIQWKTDEGGIKLIAKDLWISLNS